MSYRHGPFSQGSHEPITYLRNMPVDATTLLVAIHVAAMLVLVLIQATFPHFLEILTPNIVFTNTAWPRAHAWTALTYPLYHAVSINFAIEMFCFFMIGREVERFIGRRDFISFYGLLILVPAFALALLGGPLGKTVLYGSAVLHMGIFIGFISIYPNVQFFPGLSVRWIAWILLAVYTLICIATHNWPQLAYLWISSTLAYAYMHYTGATGHIGLRQWLEIWRQQQAEARFVRRREAYFKKQQQDESTVDGILEKISSQGMDSLSERERAILDKASRRLAGNDQSAE